MSGLFGIQKIPPDMHVDPPTSACFSRTSASAPASAAASAATMPPPPDPAITKSTVVSHGDVVISRPPHRPSDVVQCALTITSKSKYSVGTPHQGVRKMSSRTSTPTYPAAGFGAPKDRQGQATGATGLPAGTEVFSADDHI